MKKILLICAGMLSLVSGAQAQGIAAAQRSQKCGMQQLHEAMIAKDPSWAQKLESQKAALQKSADEYMQYLAQAGNERTTATVSAIPVVFHIIVDSAQFNNLGGNAGIIQRCNSQITVLNADFNHQNADSTLIPSLWKVLYGNSGIKFGLAHKDPNGSCSPGYEIKIISGSTLTDAGFSNENSAFPEAKTTGTGLPAWDVTKYYNVWCINYTGGASGLLGLTVPLGQASFYPANTEGVCILYNTLGSIGYSGVVPPGTGNWALSPDNYSLGRTLTHETGHFFEIWHTWGDDGGACPWDGGGDDGLSDTPPESNWVYGNPGYTIPGGTYNDGCQFNTTTTPSTNTQPKGIACLSYMDYTDDDAMHLFTPMQAAAMASMVLIPTGENYSLTQNPALLAACTSAGVAASTVEINSSLSIYPNPATGEVNVSVNASAEVLNEIVVINLLGQQVMTVSGQGKDYYSIDLSAMSKGIYFIKCNFASGSVTRKIVLQ